MKKLTIIALFAAALFAVSCTKTEEVQVEVIKTVEVDKHPLPDSLSLFFANTTNVNNYNELVTMFKNGYYGDIPDFIIVSYGKNNNAMNLQHPTGLKRNHISFQFFKDNKRIRFVAKAVVNFNAMEDEQMMDGMTIIYNPDFYNENQYVYKIINF
jgi:hypothetical protein